MNKSQEEMNDVQMDQTMALVTNAQAVASM